MNKTFEFIFEFIGLLLCCLLGIMIVETDYSLIVIIFAILFVIRFAIINAKRDKK